ncbi:MazG nucleotide pyrophosphohydrolase domain-containing protein [Corynebacterium bovis]|uniref:MazG nucleotide pyrophosphohydrolase domain-containing protein n=1 Tax=Corynebacterium bovis TaxID=36808 RepID=UPI00264D80CC|nr:MazG nucleotide pyrophosphohydrolase domain-containing protein [Corynebacterium bovis]MDN8578641.1 MazG nucleotide pyrophosphohydrolase domain-containing protein [Corynebacterium bovis]
MSVVLLDPRFPAMIPVDAVQLLGGDVSYTEEVPVRVRWIIADLGGHTVEESDVLVTTDLEHELVEERLERGDDLVTAPSLLVHLEPDRELEAPAGSSDPVTVSGGGVVDGQIVGTDEHTVAVAGLRRTTRTDVPASVMDEIEDAVALMARALRQGEWEQSMSHGDLVRHLREETEEFAEVVALWEAAAAGDDAAPRGEHGGQVRVDRWLEQELCTELADVLLQVLFHAEIANRRGAFDIGHVAGAFVAKLRSRAPYLFEDVERPVTAAEQNDLWARGKEREARERASRAGGLGVDGDDGEPGAAAAARDALREQVGVDGDREESALAAAEQVIREARGLGLSDGDIPGEIRFPAVGFERDRVGDADRRLVAAVDEFRTVLRDRAGTAADTADAGSTADTADTAGTTGAHGTDGTPGPAGTAGTAGAGS